MGYSPWGRKEQDPTERLSTEITSITFTKSIFKSVPKANSYTVKIRSIQL